MTNGDPGLIELCQKAGCQSMAEVKVVLNDPDGSMEWTCCRKHAREFQDWANEHVHAAGGWLTAIWDPGTGKLEKDDWFKRQ